MRGSRPKRLAAGVLAGLVLAGAAGTGRAVDVGNERAVYVRLPGAHLERGRAIWLANCEGCHGYGVADAPMPTEPAAWRARLAQGKAVLYTHAINGYFGPDDTLMPARGGNPKLSDNQVKAAVDYMAALAAHYIQLERK